MAGLDVGSRAEVSRTLGELNADGDIRIALVLRGKGAADVPDWITNVCDIQRGNVWVGDKSEWTSRMRRTTSTRSDRETESHSAGVATGEPVVALNEVSVSYGEGTRPVRQ